MELPESEKLLSEAVDWLVGLDLSRVGKWIEVVDETGHSERFESLSERKLGIHFSQYYNKNSIIIREI